MTEKHQKVINYLRDLHKHVGRIEYKDICIDLDYFNCGFPSLVEDMQEIERFKETAPRDKTIIYRARENEHFDINRSSMKLPFKTLDEISIIPEHKKHLLTSFGRCNKPNEPRFYSSNNEGTACMECLTEGFTKDLSESKAVTLSRWKIKEPLTLARINYSEESLNKFYHSDPERYKAMLRYTYLFNEDAIKKIAASGDHDVDFARQALGLFADEFAKTEIEEDYDYTISNYYCDNIFNKTNHENESEKIDGILYPSVSFAYQEYNLVLHPRAMKKIQFIDANFIWVVHHATSGNVEFIPLEKSVKADPEGNLQWKKFKW